MIGTMPSKRYEVWQMSLQNQEGIFCGKATLG
jgi:hypothetical protein